MHGDLVREDAGVPEERRPRAAATVGMEAVDHRHQRPEGEILGLERDDARLPAAEA
jgi:hypothetical protein